VKIVRFKTGNDIAYGLGEAAGVTVYQGSPFVAWEATETLLPWEAIQLLSPVIPPRWCVLDATTSITPPSWETMYQMNR
jgi:hypothetical protein